MFHRLGDRPATREWILRPFVDRVSLVQCRDLRHRNTHRLASIGGWNASIRPSKPLVFVNDAVERVFSAYKPPARRELLILRGTVLEIGAAMDGGQLPAESLKWGQPAYRRATRTEGTTIRIDALRDVPGGYGMFLHCQTTLVEDLRGLYPESFAFRGNRALVMRAGEPVDQDALRHAISMAFTYRRAARPGSRARGRAS